MLFNVLEALMHTFENAICFCIKIFPNLYSSEDNSN